jgi:hypothetical protein
MVLGEVTLDPRKILYTILTRCSREWKLTIAYLVGDTPVPIEQYGTKAAMMALADKLDDMAYKGEPLSAVGCVTVDDAESDSEDEPDETADNKREIWEKLGFKVK